MNIAYDAHGHSELALNVFFLLVLPMYSFIRQIVFSENSYPRRTTSVWVSDPHKFLGEHWVRAILTDNSSNFSILENQKNFFFPSHVCTQRRHGLYQGTKSTRHHQSLNLSSVVCASPNSFCTFILL